MELDVQENSRLYINLYHFTGLLIYSEDIGNVIDGYAHHMDLSGYAKGIYYIQIVADEVVFTKRVIHQ